jgi:hypothetical protein
MHADIHPHAVNMELRPSKNTTFSKQFILPLREFLAVILGVAQVMIHFLNNQYYV